MFEINQVERPEVWVKFAVSGIVSLFMAGPLITQIDERTPDDMRVRVLPNQTSTRSAYAGISFWPENVKTTEIRNLGESLITQLGISLKSMQIWAVRCRFESRDFRVVNTLLKIIESVTVEKVNLLKQARQKDAVGDAKENTMLLALSAISATASEVNRNLSSEIECDCQNRAHSSINRDFELEDGGHV
jgi:hypothetical protein